MNSIKKEKAGYILILLMALVSLAIFFNQDPVAQDGNYHLFKDTRNILRIPNFWNVVSNLPFLIVGISGLYQLFVTARLRIIDDIKIAYILLFSGISLVAVGSGYYHLLPNNQTLVWDRLPMTIAFMALISIIVSEFISVRIGKALLLWLILAGISSVVYWHFSELWGEGDLRYYALVQFFPILVIPAILIFFKSRCTGVSAYWWLLAAYIVAKVFEYFDGEIYSMSGVISGHSIKHIVAALGSYILLVSYQRRHCSA